jgi:acetyl-CoA carboxylase biotin carboxyl carrier protein
LNFKEILELIDKVAGSGIGAVEVEQAGTKVRIEGKPSIASPAAAAPEARAEPAPAAPPAPAPRTEPARAAEVPPAVDTEAGHHIITSPIVGTFYRSANPEAAPFINVGDRITKGKVLCIVEAMKLMNEIESDVDGVVTAIYPQNGQPVEYGEKLFAVKT